MRSQHERRGSLRQIAYRPRDAIFHRSSSHAHTIASAKSSRGVPPRSIEYAYYFCILYSIVGPALGISLNLLGAGVLVVLAGACVMRLDSRAPTVYASILFPVACAISSLIIQLTMHDASLMDAGCRLFVNWIMVLIIIQSLTLRRGFLHRFALAAFLIGLTTLPFLTVYTPSAELERMGLDKESGVGMANPNALASWFGFCCVYLAIRGVEAKRLKPRVIAWAAAVVCLYIVALTVSRGSLFAVGLSVVIGLRHSLKRGFVPVLSLMVFGWIIYVSGLFEQSAGLYAARATEDTGRFQIWSIMVRRVLDSPLSGVGISNVLVSLPGRTKLLAPHNGFLSIAVPSGIIPLAFFVVYWWRAARATFRTADKRADDAPFRVPLFVYVFLMTLSSNFTFTYPWSIVTLATAMTAASHPSARRVLVRHSGGIRGSAPASMASDSC